MSVTSRQLARTVATVSRQAKSQTATRTYSDRPYPFTKPSNPGTVSKKPSDEGAKAAYPFTKPSPPTPVASPSGRVDRPGPPHDSSEVISKEFEDPVDIPRPDYNVAEADYRTSTFSPIPMRVQDGSEPMDVAPAAVTSGAPVDLQARTVR